MKTFILRVAAFSLVMVYSCVKTEEITPSNSVLNITDASATNTVNAVVKNAYPTASNIKVGILENSKMYGADFMVKGENYEATITSKGEFNTVYVKTEGITLPEGIITVLKDKYPGYKLIGAVKGKDGAGKDSYKVAISVGEKLINLVFDDKNAIVSAFEVAAPKTPTLEVPFKIYSVKLADLPANIQSQLAGYEFILGSVKASTTGTEKTYFVSTKKDGLIYDFVFDKDGKLVSTKKYEPAPKIEYQLLTDANTPKAVKDYLADKHAGWKIEKGYNILKNSVLAGTYVVVTKDKSIAYIEFDAEGKVTKSTVNTTTVVVKPTVEIPTITVKELAQSAIPAVIKDYLDKTYAGWTYTKGTITLKNNVAETYYLFITAGTLKYHIYFDKDGKFLSAKRG